MRRDILTRILPLLLAAVVASTPALAETEIARLQALAPYFGAQNVAAVNVTATDNVFENRVVVTWPKAINPNVFWRVKRNNVLLTVLSSQDTSFADTTGLSGQVYQYCVSLTDANNQTQIDVGCDNGSRTIFGPTAVAASDGLFDFKVAVTWSDQSTIEAAYELYRSNVMLATLPVNSDGYTDSTAVPGQTYSYCVRAVDAVGQFSAQACDNGFRGFAAPPAQVQASDGQFPSHTLITWGAPTTTAGFRVYRNNIQIAALDDTARMYVDNSGTNHVAYDYCVTSLNDQSQESIKICDTGGFGILAAPVNMQASDALFDDKVRITWSDPGDTEDGFRVYREAPLQAPVLVTTLAANVTSHDDVDAAAGPLYRYCVVAFSNAGGVSDSTCAMGRRSAIVAPTAVDATDGTLEDRVDITWESSATSVVLFKILRDGTVFQTLPGTARSTSDFNNASNAIHQYCVRAVTALEIESASDCDAGHRALNPVTGLSASDNAFEAYVLVSWTDASLFETGYVVERKLAAAPSYTIVDSVSAGHTAYLDYKGTPGVQYTYRVRTFDAKGTATSGPTDVGSRTLSPPGSLAATDGEFENKIVLTWLDQSAAEVGYRIYRKTGAGAYAVKDTVPPNTTTYTDATSIVFGTTYTYKVVAYDMRGESQGAEDSGNTAILAPGDVNASETYTDKVTITWVDRSGIEAGYVVTRDGTTLTTTGANATTYTDNTAVAGATYQYCVQTTSATTQSALACDAGSVAVVVSGVTAQLVAPVTPPVNVSGPNGVTVDGDEAAYSTRTGGLDTLRILSRTNGVWSEVKTLQVTSTLSTSPPIDLHGNELILGQNGSVLIFTKNSGTWSNPVTVTGATSQFGREGVAIFEDRALIIEWDNTGNGTLGKAYIYRLSSGTWTQEHMISPALPQFGFDADLDGSRAVIASNNGAHIYKRTGTSWALEQTLGVQALSVAIDGENIAVGNFNGAFVYTLINGTWTLSASIPNAAPGSRQVGLDGNLLLVSSTGGAAGLYERQPAGWVQVRSISAADGYGASVAARLGGGTGLMTAGTFFGPQKLYLFDVLSPPGGLTASDGTFAARVQLNWADNSSNEDGFHIYRDGALVDSTEANVHSYSDYDAEPGRVHEYSVAAFVGTTESSRSSDLGRRPADGSLTGRVATRAGAAVGGVEVCLDPAPASALLFDGVSGKAEVTGFETGATAFDLLTIEFWIKTRAVAGTPFSYVRDATHRAIVTLEAGGKLAIQINGSAKSSLSPQSVNDGQWHHVAIRWNGGLTGHTSPSNVVISVDGDPFQGIGDLVEIGNAITTGGVLTVGQFAGELDEVRAWRVLRSLADLAATRNRPVDPAAAGLMLGLSFDEGAGPASFDGASQDEYARLSGGAFWAEDIAPVQACAVTDDEGNYSMREIRYGKGLTLRVTPKLGPHQFEPAYKTVTLNGASPVQNELAFSDISSFTLAGRVILDNTTCAAAGVQVLLDDVVFGTTGEDGRFAIAAGFGRHTLKLRQGNRAFFPASYTLEVGGDRANLDFTDKTVRMLTGKVGGGCNQPIGTVTFQIRTEDGCFLTTGSTASDIAVALGPRKYQIQVTNVTGVPTTLDRAEILRFFQALGPQTVDLTERDTTVNLIYRAPIVVEISGFDLPSCPTLTLPTGATVDAVPVLQQGQKVPLKIRVFEDYGNDNHCPLDSTVVTVFDEILDEQDVPVQLTVRNGETSYTTIANTPNIFPGRIDAQGNNRSFQKPLTVVAEVPGQGTVTATSWVMVTGQRPRAATFVSTTNEIPLMILRDPPGDGSSAFIEEGTTTCTRWANLGLESIASGINVKTEIGLKFHKGTPFISTTTAAQVVTENKYRIGIEGTQDSSLSVCTETLERWSTPSDNSWLDGDGDVMRGAALNLIFAKTDVLNLEGCNVKKSESITMGSEFASTYVYTVKHIRETIIPQLEDLAIKRPTQTAYYQSQAANWRRHLALNDSLKAAATLKKNLSFSSGADYEYSNTVDSTGTFAWSVRAFTSAELGLGFNFEETGNGGFNQWAIDLKFEYQRQGGTEFGQATTVGYTLKDDDAGDFFSVDVKDDAKYGTPVFKTVSGRSSCPVEKDTQPRDGVEIRIDPPLQDGVDPDGAASFVLSVTNTSDSEEEREYFIQPIQTTNPDGASIFLVGDTFLQLAVNLKPRQTHTWDLTIRRGPSKFRYDNIALMVLPTCQFDYWRKTGVVLQSDTATFSVHYQAPCSDITLFEPQPGWTYNKAQSLENPENKIGLTLTDFQVEIAERDSIEVVGAQYRAAETETWFNIGEILRKDLEEGRSVELDWDVTHVADGQYELRAFTRCAAGFTYSPTATGRIDRKSPTVFGTPQPADSLLSLGEDIAITFDEDINCNTATPANVSLQINNPDGSVETIREIAVACNGRTLILTPLDPAYPLLEGKKLRARVTGVEDLLGNPMVGPNSSAEVAWRTSVRRNVFTWMELSVAKQAPYRNPGSLTARLVNGTSAAVNFNLTGLPVWLSAVPSSGTIASGDSLPVQLVISPTETSLLPGNAPNTYTATINANVTSPPITSPLAVQVTVFCQKPDWVVNARDYQYSMTVVAQEQIAGVNQTQNPDDKIAAFVGNQLRGVSSPILVPQLNTWLTFITVYSNRATGENVRFQIFDDSDCRLFTGTTRTVRFEADRREGTTATPVVLNAQDLPPGSVQQIAVNDGWTWISFNLSSPTDMTVNGVLGDLNASSGDLVKSQTLFSQFDPTAGWAGTLGDFSNLESYALKTTGAGTIIHEGMPVPVATTFVPIATGWSWIPYLPQTALAINTTLQLLTPQHGDLIKSQTHFAQYVKSGSVASWLGNLTTMNPGLGYRVFLANPSINQNQFKYFVPPALAASTASAVATAGRVGTPVSATNGEPTSPTSEGNAYPTLVSLGPGWEVDARAYPYNMTVTAALEVGGVPLNDDRFVLAAMMGDEVRGVAQVQYVEGVDKHLVFLMVYGNEIDSGPLTFRVFDMAKNEVRAVDGTIGFAPDLVAGSIMEPVTFKLGDKVAGGSLPTEFSLSQNAPNPPKGRIVIRYALPTGQRVVLKLHDLAGREVMRLVDGDRPPGFHTVTLDASSLASGLYFYRIQAGGFTQSRKMIVVN